MKQAQQTVWNLCVLMANKETSAEDRRIAYEEMLGVVRAAQSGVKPKQERIKLDNPDFLAFWAAYPNKVAKGYAEKALTKALKETDLQTILKGVQWYKMNKPDETAWAFPASWLNAQRWLDGQSDIEKPAEQIDTSQWPEWKQKIAKAFNVTIVNTWFKDVEVNGYASGADMIAVFKIPKSSYQWIKDRYSQDLQRIFGNIEIRSR